MGKVNRYVLVLIGMASAFCLVFDQATHLGYKVASGPMFIIFIFIGVNHIFSRVPPVG